MAPRLVLALVSAFGAAISIGAFSCGGSTDTHGGLGGGGGASSESTASHRPTGSNSGGAGTFAGPSSGTSSGCQNHCSSDLHDVLDCHGNVVKTCPMDEGCGKSGCVPACQSADENKSSIGCDYYVVDPDIISAGAGACFAAYVANTWTSDVTITLERAGQNLPIAAAAVIPQGSGQALTYAPLPNGKLPPGQVAIVFLTEFNPPIAPCPAGVTAAFTTADAAVHGTGYGDAFHLVTSAPVVLYDIFPYGGGNAAATSATLLLPTSAWDTNYIGVDAFRKSTFVAEAQPSMDIVASEDGTNVTISPTAAIVGGTGVLPTGMGVPITYVLNKGQILQFTQDAELIGSAIQSDKPIAVWGGASCLNIDVGVQACDSAHQQIPPVKALGSEYIAVRFRNRFPGTPEETPPWRIVGAVDGTTLTYDPPTPPTGAPTTLGSGQVAEFRSAGLFGVKSQDMDHPFYMSGHMEGCEAIDPGFEDCRGDPEFVNTVPPAQWLSSYVFFTDPTYPETNLVLIRSKANGQFEDVSLDCAGTITGWAPIGMNGDYEYARIDLVTGNFMGVNGCDNGRHEITSKAPFGLTVWGWGSAATGGSFLGDPNYTQCVSYAYPAGASVQPINQVVVPPNPK